jgi:hypothetical protein
MEFWSLLRNAIRVELNPEFILEDNEVCVGEGFNAVDIGTEVILDEAGLHFTQKVGVLYDQFIEAEQLQRCRIVDEVSVVILIHPVTGACKELGAIWVLERLLLKALRADDNRSVEGV